MNSRIFFEHLRPTNWSDQTFPLETDAYLLKSGLVKNGVGLANGSSLRVHTANEDCVAAALQRSYSGTKRLLSRQKLRSKHIYVDHNDDSKARAAMASYKSLRTNVLQKLDGIGAKSLMVVGPTQNVGKTLTAINLALAIAKLPDRRVFLVDLDLRSPSVHVELGFESYGSIVDVAAGRKTLEDVLVSPNVGKLTILPGKGRWEDSSERLTDSAMASVFEELHAIPNSIIIYDTPPTMGCDDVAAIAPAMDASLLVVSQNVTKRSEMRDSIQQLAGSINIIGVTINRSTEADLNAYYYG